MKTTKKACLVFSLLCLGVFSGCDTSEETARQNHDGLDGTQRDFQYPEDGGCVLVDWRKTVFSGPSN